MISGGFDGSWVSPYWLERQLDPLSPDFTSAPLGDGLALANVTHRSGAYIGNVATMQRCLVDPRGLLTPFVDGWSLDWWIGAEDHWHMPSRAVAVRQRLIEGAPVVETAMRVPGGDALHRAYAMQSTSAGPCAVIELENRSAVPFAAAISVRPYNVFGPAIVDSIELDGASVTVNGSDAFVFSKTPGLTLFSTKAEGDVAVAVLAGVGADAPRSEQAPTRIEDPGHRATAAFVFPLPHTAVLRAVVLLAHNARNAHTAHAGRTTRGSRRSSRKSIVAFPDAVPSAERVAKGWELQTRRGLQIELPDNRLQDTVDAARRHLLLSHGGMGLVDHGGGPLDLSRAATVLSALDGFGFHDEAAEVLAAWPDRPTLDGAALLAIAEHWRLARDVELVEALVGPIAKAIHWIDKNRVGRRARIGSQSGDAPISILGLTRIAAALDDIDQPEVAHRSRAIADEMRNAFDPAIGSSARELDRAIFSSAGAIGLSPVLTMREALAELEAGDPRCLDRLDWMVEAASATTTWPTAIHPRSGGGSAGSPQDAEANALFLLFVRRLLLRELTLDSGLALMSIVPQSWLGQPIDVRKAPTAFGLCSYAVRWHGDRPALLWEIDPHQGVGVVEITVPGLDAAFSTSELRGEALLAPVAAPILGSSFA